MYTAYVDGRLFYAPNLAGENSGGYAITSGQVETEVNLAGSFRFTIPRINPEYESFQVLRSIVTVMADDVEIFRGRVLNTTRNIYNEKSVYCEGWISVLLDSVVRPYEFSGSVESYLTQLITRHNNMVEPWKRLSVGRVTVTDPNDYIVRESSDYPNTWDEITDKLLNILGGYIVFRRETGINYIDYLESYEGNSDQSITFGQNLLDLEEYISGEDVFTALIPLGAMEEGEDAERVNIRSVNGGRDYITDETATALFGSVWRQENWDDVTQPSNLLRKAKEFLRQNIELSVSLNMRAFDLHIIDVDTESFHLGDMVRVVSKPHGMDQDFMCSRISLDLLNPDSSEYSFGLSYKTLTGNTQSQIKNIYNNIKPGVVPTGPTIERFEYCPSGALWGDANNDGVVDQDDVDIVEQYVADNPVEIDVESVDFNDDGLVTVKDLARLRNLVDGLEAGQIIVKTVTTLGDGSTIVTWDYLTPANT